MGGSPFGRVSLDINDNTGGKVAPNFQQMAFADPSALPAVEGSGFRRDYSSGAVQRP